MKDPNLIPTEESFDLKDVIKDNDILDFVINGDKTKHALLTERQFAELEIRGNKQLRKELDQIIGKLKHLPNSRERSISYTKLQEAMMWLGMDLARLREAGVLNDDLPYTDSKDPSNTKINETADNLQFTKRS